MEPKLQELVNQIGTDVSGKWIAVDKVGQLANLIVQECAEIADKAEPYKANDLIKKHFGLE